MTDVTVSQPAVKTDAQVIEGLIADLKACDEDRRQAIQDAGQLKADLERVRQERDQLQAENAAQGRHIQLIRDTAAKAPE